MAKQSLADKFNEKVFMFNLGKSTFWLDFILFIFINSILYNLINFTSSAAPYVSEKHIKELNEILPYIDFLFGNEQEYMAFAKAKGYQVGGRVCR